MSSGSNSFAPLGREVLIFVALGLLFGAFGLVLCLRNGSLFFLALFAASAMIQVRRFAVWRREETISIRALPLLPLNARVESVRMTAVRVSWMASLFAACGAAGLFLTVFAAAEGWAFGTALGAAATGIRRARTERELRCRVFTDVVWTTPVIGARGARSPQLYKLNVDEPTSSVAQNF